jgi:hypothetical protein
MTPPPRPIRVSLEIERGTDPLSGVTIGEDGSAQAFTGWTGLTTSLMSVIDRAEDEPAPTAPTTS